MTSAEHMAGPSSEPIDATALIERLRSIDPSSRLLVALDFDGTLAPLVDDPSTARIPAATMDAVLGLSAAPNTRVALVSGRSLASLTAVAVDIPGNILMVGSHGVEYRLDQPEDSEALTLEEAEHLARLREAVDGAVAGVEGVGRENKPVGLTVHTRTLPRDRAAAVVERVRNAVDRLGLPVTERTGKDILEYSVRDAHKGDAINRLRDYTQSNVVFYAGDDVTDEDAFRALRQGDLGVKCGRGDTAAQFRVSSGEDLTEVLRLLAAFRVG